jgi:hypothetical protein
MKKTVLTFLGLALILAGALALAYQGISYTRKEKLLDVGPLKASVDKQETIPVPRWLGGAMLAGGVVSLIAGIRKSEH